MLTWQHNTVTSLMECFTSVGYASIKLKNDSMAILNIQILRQHQFNFSRNYILSQSGYLSMLPETFTFIQNFP